MIVYKIDQPTQLKANDQIRDMGAVLSEIAPTLRILQDLLKQHETSMSIPSLDSYREDLQTMIPEAIRLSHLIAVNSQRLASVSDQATKQLTTIDNVIQTALVTKTGQTHPTEQAQGTTLPRSNYETQSTRLFQRQA